MLNMTSVIIQFKYHEIFQEEHLLQFAARKETISDKNHKGSLTENRKTALLCFEQLVFNTQSTV